MISNPGPLPTLPESDSPETATQRGLRVLSFVLTTTVSVTIETVDLERADAAYPVAVSSADMLPAVRERLSAVRHQILAELRIRRAQLSPGPAQLPGPCTDERPNMGPMAPLQPRPGPIQPRPGAAVTRDDIAF